MTFQKVIPGQFDITYKGDLIPGTDYIEIPISGFGNLDLYIAAHARYVLARIPLRRL